jgi:hypothetical protein
LQEGKGVEVGASKDAEGLRIQAKIPGEVGSDDGIRDTVKHGNDIESRENGEDEKRFEGLRLFCHGIILSEIHCFGQLISSSPFGGLFRPGINGRTRRRMATPIKTNEMGRMKKIVKLP